MTQEDKELLLKDLCARLPYGVRISLEYENKHLEGTLDAVYPIEDDRVIIDNLSEAIAYCNVRCGGFHIEENNIKPYLFPLSSMTEEQKKEYHNLCSEEEREEIEFGEWVTRVYYHNTIESIDWLNAHHFDYRGLIERGLALDATGLNIY